MTQVQTHRYIYTNITAEHAPDLAAHAVSKVAVIYHDQCMDGAVAAAAFLAWQIHVTGDSEIHEFIEFIPARYGTEPGLEYLRDRVVVLLDFSYPAATLVSIAGVAQSVTVFDHHQTAVKPLVEYAKSYEQQPDTHCPFFLYVGTSDVFSGAGLVWYGLEMKKLQNKRLQDFVIHAEYHDLWRHQGSLTDTSLWVNYWFSYVNEWFVEDGQRRQIPITYLLRTILDTPPGVILNFGRLVLGEKLKQIRSNIERNQKLYWIDGQNIPICPAPHAQASLTCQLMQEELGTEFAITWDAKDPGRIEYSLRSRKIYDVSAIAKQFGGGGHRKAAGFISDQRPDQLFNVLEKAPPMTIPPFPRID